jgi:hypothetical protein
VGQRIVIGGAEDREGQAIVQQRDGDNEAENSIVGQGDNGVGYSRAEG